VFKLDTVTYGTKPSSFLAVRAMHQLSADEHIAFPLGAEAIRQDFYVDDLISGAISKDKAVIIHCQGDQTNSDCPLYLTGVFYTRTGLSLASHTG